MSFARNPNEVVKMTEKMLRGKLIEEPRWFKAALKFPNTGSYVKAPSDIVSDAPLPLEERERDFTSRRTLSSNLPLTGRANVRKIRFRPPKPQTIVYPEDELRREFFKDHPYETCRPVTLVENYQSQSNWKALLENDKSVRISNEDVIKFQLYLMAKGDSKEVAYEKATRALSEHRVYEETEEEIAQQNAKHYGALLGKDCIQLGQEREAEFLEKSRVAIEISTAMRSSTEFTSEKSFKQDDSEEPILNPVLSTPTAKLRK